MKIQYYLIIIWPVFVACSAGLLCLMFFNSGVQVQDHGGLNINIGRTVQGSTRDYHIEWDYLRKLRLKMTQISLFSFLCIFLLALIWENRRSEQDHI